MKKKKIILTFVSIFLIGLLCSYFYFKEQNNKCKSISPIILNSMSEIDNNFLVLPDKSVVFSVNDSCCFSLKQYKGGITTPLIPLNKNAFKPTLLLGEVTAIQDIDGDAKYISTSSELNKYIESNAISLMYSFRNGELVILQMRNDKNLILIDLKAKTKRLLLNTTRNIRGVDYSETGNYLVLSYEKKLLFVDLLTLDISELAKELEGEKLNPHIFDDYVYFINNDSSEYYQVFKVNPNKAMSPIQCVYKTNHDIRLPKISDNFLYFIEVINSEYILKRLNINTKSIDEITHQGVVYNYEFCKEGEIALAYADMFTPRSLILYKEADNSFYNITGSQINHGLSYKLIKNEDGTSAYEIKSKEKNTKGVILFIHPDIHSDFSPRWDGVLMNLCYNGYTVIAPNYPMSSGFGKTFYNKEIHNAIEDLRTWKSYIQKQYINIPIYCIAESSGNVLMEILLTEYYDGIKAAASLFGIPSASVGKVPILYVLGENDPIVNFTTRKKMLRSIKSDSPISIVSYADEGHWFRKRGNIQDAVYKILDHFCQ